MLDITDIFVIVLLALLGLAIIVLAYRFKKEKDPAKKPSPTVILGLSVIAVGLSVFQILREVERSAPFVYDPLVDEALGRSLTEYFLPQSDGGLKVVIISRGHDGEEAFTRSAQVRLDAFLASLRGHGIEDPVVVSPIAHLDTGSGAELYYMDVGLEMGINPDVLRQVWEEHANADVVVSMEGLPSHGMDGLLALKPENSQLYVLDLYQMWNWMPYVENGALDGVVTYRPDPDWSLQEGSDSEIFISRFVFINPENYANHRHVLPEDYFGVQP